jgi:ABC-2 type transport system permease protein
MTATTPTTPAASARAPAHSSVTARPAGFLSDCVAVATRSIRAVPREMEVVVPALVVPVFFYVINVGALSKAAEQGTNLDFKAFQLPVAILFAVTGLSRASALVTDIQNGYFDRLLMTPIRRLALLLGLMMADLTLIVTLSIPVVFMGFVVGVRFETGAVGIVVFLAMAGLWGLAFTGFPYAIALKTGNPAAVNTSFILFFPFMFLTTSFLPEQALEGWLQAIAAWNPVTYLLAGMRSLLYGGWDLHALGVGFAAIAGVGAVSMTLAFSALRGRLKRG